MTAQKENTTWAKQSGYIWSLLGSAVGFANIVTFSAQCYRNGGGAFLLPFLLAMTVLGLPMLYLEATIGHRWKKPLVGCYQKALGSPAKIFGWLAVIAVTTIGAFYLVLTGYTVAYMGFSAFGGISSDTATFFTERVLGMSSGLSEFGSFSGVVFAATTTVILFTAYVMQRGIQGGIEKACSIFLPMLSVLIVVFAIASAFLPGAMAGWAHFLVPDFSRLTDAYLWRDVFGHLFYSFSLGLGIPMVMGSNMLIGGLAQIVVFSWFCREIREDAVWNTDWQTRASYWLLSTIAPAILLVILGGNIVQDLFNPGLAVVVRWSWFAGALALATWFTYAQRQQEVPAAVVVEH
jgi:SNF family Na+-dependent transporter